MEKFYTVKELTIDFNVVKQTIYDFINKPYFKKYLSKNRINNHNVTVINEQGYQILKRHFKSIQSSKSSESSPVSPVKKSNNNNGSLSINSKLESSESTVSSLVQSSESIVQMIKSKDETIEILKKELDFLKSSLDHEQQINMQLATKIKELQQPKQSNDESQPKQNKKHWWQFWKK